MENRLATIVFIDMQGYTKRSAQQTIEEMKLFHDEMTAFVKTHLEKYQGVMVKTLGDGFLARFDSPTQAVQCGLEIQRRLEARNAQMLNPDSFVRFRIGINTGEVGIDESGDLFGDPVNIASRIQSYAEPNEVYISESTFLAMNRNEVGAQDLGPQMFKNATREIRIYKVIKQGAAGLVLPTSKAAKGAAAHSAAASAGGESREKDVPAWKTGLKVAAGLFVAVMCLNGIRHTFLHRAGRSAVPPQPATQRSVVASSRIASPAPHQQAVSPQPSRTGTMPAPVIAPNLAPPPPPARPSSPPRPSGDGTATGVVAHRPSGPEPDPRFQPPFPPHPPFPPRPPGDGVTTGSVAGSHPRPEPSQRPGRPELPGREGQENLPSPLELDPDNPPPGLDLNPRQQGFVREMQELHKAGNLDKAIARARQQEEQARQLPAAKRLPLYILLGELYQKAGRGAEADAAFTTALELAGSLSPLKARAMEARIRRLQKKGN